MLLSRRLVPALVGLLLLTLSTPARAQNACTAETWRGAYGYTLNGFVYDDQGYLYMLGAVGRMVSDGAGNVTGHDAFSFDGTLVKREFTGTYTINEDCTGSLTMTNAAGASVHADLVFVADGKEILLVDTDSGYILTGTLKQQFSSAGASTTGSATEPSQARGGH